MSSHPPARPLRVLWVHAPCAEAGAAVEALRARGHAVTAVPSAEDALDLTGFVPEVVVAAVRLTGSSGLDLLAALRERGTRPRAILVSEVPTVDDCRRALRLGAAELLPEPLDPRELVEAVEGPASRPAPTPCEPATRLERSAPATSASIEAAVRAVAAFALENAVDPTVRMRLATACYEVLDNVRLHAYPDGGGTFCLHAHLERREVVVRVRDEGTGFDAARARLESTPAPFGAPAADDADAPGEPIRGGLARAAALVESLRVESSRHGTAVTLRVAHLPSTFEEEVGADLSELDFLTPSGARRILRAVRSGVSGDMHNLSPALAVTIGRLLAGPTARQLAQTALWS